MNTLDLIVQGTTALFGVNGEFVASFELPPPTVTDVLVATDFRAENIVEGREIIYSTFEVWDAPDLAVPRRDERFGVRRERHTRVDVQRSARLLIVALHVVDQPALVTVR